MTAKNFQIKRMTRKELDIAIVWVANEGWNPGLYDRDCFFNTDPHGFFIGLVNNEPVACIQENYKRSGFKFAYRNIRFQGKATGEKVNYKDIVKLSTIPFDQLIDYDNRIFPSSRPKFLNCWINQPESLAIGALNGFVEKGTEIYLDVPEINPAGI